jgi:hypothetical protein
MTSPSATVFEQIQSFLEPRDFDRDTQQRCLAIEHDLSPHARILGAARVIWKASPSLALLTEHELRVYSIAEGGPQARVLYSRIFGSALSSDVLTIQTADQELDLFATGGDLRAVRDELIRIAPSAANPPAPRERAGLELATGGQRRSGEPSFPFGGCWGREFVAAVVTGVFVMVGLLAAGLSVGMGVCETGCTAAEKQAELDRLYPNVLESGVVAAVIGGALVGLLVHRYLVARWRLNGGTCVLVHVLVYGSVAAGTLSWAWYSETLLGPVFVALLVIPTACTVAIASLAKPEPPDLANLEPATGAATSRVPGGPAPNTAPGGERRGSKGSTLNTVLIVASALVIASIVLNALTGR